MEKFKEKLIGEINKELDFYRAFNVDSNAFFYKNKLVDIINGLNKVWNIVYNFKVDEVAFAESFVQYVKAKIEIEKVDVDGYMMSDDLGMRQDGKWIMKGLNIGESCVDEVLYMLVHNRLDKYCEV